MAKIKKKKKHKYVLERGEKFLRFIRLVCDCDQGSEQEQQQQASSNGGIDEIERRKSEVRGKIWEL